MEFALVRIFGNFKSAACAVVISFSTRAFKSPEIPLNETIQPVIPFNDDTKDLESCDVSRKKASFNGVTFHISCGATRTHGDERNKLYIIIHRVYTEKKSGNNNQA